jgi:predicted  nucleic acid-binding Zn-ribbon protein
VSIETPIEFELEQYKDRVDAMQMANELLREERDRFKDASESLHTELEACKQTLKQAESVISRLRTHIAQGVEL